VLDTERSIWDEEEFIEYEDDSIEDMFEAEEEEPRPALELDKEDKKARARYEKAHSKYKGWSRFNQNIKPAGHIRIGSRSSLEKVSGSSLGGLLDEIDKHKAFTGAYKEMLEDAYEHRHEIDDKEGLEKFIKKWTAHFRVKGHTNESARKIILSKLKEVFG